MKKKICILGSTGSIGKTTLKILSQNKKDFEVVLLSGNSNVDLLISQAKKFKPIYIYYNNFYFKDKIQSAEAGLSEWICGITLAELNSFIKELREEYFIKMIEALQDQHLAAKKYIDQKTDPCKGS